MTISAKVVASILLLGLGVASAEAQLTASEKRGRAIYFGSDGSALERATAQIQGMSVELPAGSFPCSSCHGERGQGQAERGVAPSDLSQDALTRPYTVEMAAGRVRPPYTRDLFERAITEGIDAGGTELQDAMPRFSLSPNDVDDLWAYLARLKDEKDPGLSDDRIRIGLAIPFTGGSVAAAQATFGVVDALFAELNERGGIHGRSVELVPYDENSGEPLPDDLFVVLGARNLNDGVPDISARLSAAPGPDDFALTAGRNEQIAALRAFAVTEWGELRAEEVSCEGALSGVLVLTDANCAGKAARAKRLLVPFETFIDVSPELRKTWPSETYVALPLSVEHVPSGAQASFAKVRARSQFPSAAPIAEAEAYSAGVLAIEGLMRAGRAVTRKKFKEKIENIQGFVGGMTPPAGFSPNDHVGSNGANIVKFNPSTNNLAGSGEWVDPTRENG